MDITIKINLNYTQNIIDEGFLSDLKYEFENDKSVKETYTSFKEYVKEHILNNYDSFLDWDGLQNEIDHKIDVIIK